VNDIVIFSKTFDKYVKHLYTIFDLLNSKKVILLTKKSYLKYFIVTLLKQKVNAFDFIVVVNKIVAITTFDFLYKLIDFELYLELIE